MKPTHTENFRSRGDPAGASADGSASLSSPRRARSLLQDLVEELRPLEREAREAKWEAATDAGDEKVAAAADAEAELRTFFSRSELLERIETALASEDLPHEIRRQLELLALDFRENQLPEEQIRDLVRRSTEIEKEFWSFRAELDGETVSNNELQEVFLEEDDPDRRRRAWEASKQIGARVGDGIRDLARRRNEVARGLGYRDFYELRLELQELDESRMFDLLEGVESATAAPYRELKGRLDRKLAGRFGVTPDELRPWHYDDPFFQELPSVAAPDLDPVFRDADLETITRRFFLGIGLDVSDVLERSDLYERQGKDQHAFCTDIDREGDVRVLANIRGNERWMATLLHEFGHAAYDRYIPPALPYVLRQPPHTLSTEAIALLFDRLVRLPGWLIAVAGVPEEDLPDVDDWEEVRALERLIAVRWMLVMVHFERLLYRDPGRGDLSAAWWDLVERFQEVPRPEGREGHPDWAAKIHFGIAPVYYQNYLLGELLAFQLQHVLVERFGQHWFDDDEAGDFLRDQYFVHGARLRWDRLVREATGRELSADALSAELLHAGP